MVATPRPSSAAKSASHLAYNVRSSAQGRVSFRVDAPMLTLDARCGLRERMGSCILCHDVQNFEPTVEEMTRVYALYPVKKPPPPPAYPEKGVQMVKHYQACHGEGSSETIAWPLAIALSERRARRFCGASCEIS